MSWSGIQDRLRLWVSAARCHTAAIVQSVSWFYVVRVRASAKGRGNQGAMGQLESLHACVLGCIRRVKLDAIQVVQGARH